MVFGWKLSLAARIGVLSAQWLQRLQSLISRPAHPQQSWFNWCAPGFPSPEHLSAVSSCNPSCYILLMSARREKNESPSRKTSRFGVQAVYKYFLCLWTPAWPYLKMANLCSAHSAVTVVSTKHTCSPRPVGDLALGVDIALWIVSSSKVLALLCLGLVETSWCKQGRLSALVLWGLG